MTDEEELDKIEDMIQDQREKWNRVIEDLSKKLTDELKYSIELEAAAIALRQKIMTEMTSYAIKINRSMSKLKIIRRAKFEYYATKYQVKVNTTEKNILIEGDTAIYQAKIDMFDNFTAFLSECLKSVDHIIYGVQNKIKIANITGLD